MIKNKPKHQRGGPKQYGPPPRNEMDCCRQPPSVQKAGYQPETLFTHSDIGYTSDGYTVIDDLHDLSMATTSARTTFYARDVSDNRELFNRLYVLNRGRGHTWEEDSYRKSAVRTEGMLLRCDAILQSCEVPNWVRRAALRQVRRQDLRGYSRYYEGSDGACVAFGLVVLFDTAREAKESEIASRAASVVPGFDEGIVQEMIEYAFNR